MGLFSDIMHKIVGAAEAAVGAAPAITPIGGATVGAPAADTAASLDLPDPATVSAAPAAPIDVGAVLAGLAAQKGGGGNYKTSIVDLLKLLDLDSSLTTRKQLAEELNVHTGADGTAEENTALHQAVMAKIEQNGGTVPTDMKG